MDCERFSDVVTMKTNSGALRPMEFTCWTDDGEQWRVCDRRCASDEVDGEALLSKAASGPPASESDMFKPLLSVCWSVGNELDRCPEGGQSLKSQVSYPPPAEMVKQAQQILNQLGYDSGEPTGEVRGNTVAAVLDYQHHHGLPTRGDIDVVLMDHLKAQIGTER